MAAKKKDAAPEARVMLGRPGNNLKLGIVGMPNVGKSTLFNTISKLNVPASNFPFCTIDPNVARVPVPDERFDWLCANIQHRGEVPACVTIIDIAGLIAGASTGAGLGNQFLSHISEADGILHVVRAFEDEEVTHVEDSVDPVRDLEVIRAELRAKDLQIVGKALEAAKKAQRIKKSDDVEVLEKLQEVLQTTEVRFATWSNKEVDVLNTMQLLTAKPATVLVNLSEDAYKKKRSKWLKPLHDYITEKMPGEVMIPFSGAMESTLQNLESDEARAAWLTENGTKSALDKIIKQGYESLNLIHYFTVGEVEIRCWTIQRGTKAPGAAGVIHSDFENNFISGDIYYFNDLKEHGTEAAVKARGLVHQVGKQHVMEDGSICHWKAGQSGAGKK